MQKVITSEFQPMWIDRSRDKNQFSIRTPMSKKALEVLKSQNLPVCLVGLRRTGKTVILNQIWEDMHTEKSVFVEATTYATVKGLFELIENRDIDLLVIDELSKVYDLECDMYETFLNTVINRGIKMIVTGTESLRLMSANKNNILGRYKYLQTYPIKYEDWAAVNKGTFEEYLLNDASFVTDVSIIDYVVNDICESEELAGNRSSVLRNLLKEEVKNLVYKVLLEIMFISKRKGKIKEEVTIKPPEYDFSDIVIFPETDSQVINKHAYRAILDRLLKLNVIAELHQDTLEGDTYILNYYITSSQLYWEMLNQFKIKQVHEKKQGQLFEAAGTYNIVSKLKRGTPYYKVRVDEDAEVDLCIVVGDVIHYIDFKRTATKNHNLFHKKILEDKNTKMKSGYTMKNHILTLVGGEMHQQNVNFMRMEDFINNIEEILVGGV